MALTWIKKVSLSGNSSVRITGMTSTYQAYQFRFVNIHPQNANGNFQFQMHRSYVTTNSTFSTTGFVRYTWESGGNGVSFYTGSNDSQGNTNNFQNLARSVGGGTGGDDSSINGTLTVFAPYRSQVNGYYLFKSFYSETQYKFISGSTVGSQSYYMQGFVTSPTDDMEDLTFKMSFGNLDDGEIHMYGIEES